MAPRLTNFAQWVARHKRWLIAALVLSMAVLAFVAIRRLTAEIRPADVRRAFDSLGWHQIGGAVALTAASYVSLTFYDAVALRVIGRPLPWWIAAMASFASYTISHNLGLSMLTGGSARYRVYSRAGLNESEVARIVVIAGVTFWAGVGAVAGLALAIRPGALPLFGTDLPGWLERGIGIAIPVAIAAIVLGKRHGGAVRLFGWSMPLPDWRQSIALLIVSAVELATASAALFVLLPGADPALFPLLFLGYALAIVVALVTHVPGGIGVFEAVILATLPMDDAGILAALIAYRVIYYIAPLVVAVLLMAVQEGRQWRGREGRRIALGVRP